MLYIARMRSHQHHIAKSNHAHTTYKHKQYKHDFAAYAYRREQAIAHAQMGYRGVEEMIASEKAF